MKYKLLLTVVAVFSVVVASAQMNDRITVNISNRPLSEAVSVIENASRFTFFYDAGKTDMTQRVSLSAVNLPVDDAMRQMLSPVGVNFEVKGNQIVLITPSAPVGNLPENVTITVLDNTDYPVIGAAILKADGTGEITDLDGNCTIRLTQSDRTLTVTCLGYQTKTVEVGAQSTIVVHVEEEALALDATVVVGYGVQKKVNLTGAVAAVTAETLQDRPVASVGQALQGVVPNLNVTQSSGKPGAGSSFNIRGNTSPNGGSPLVLVDGVETYLDRINSNDIASITVLKDASSAAIYGARAAFGVILVTTKSGKTDMAPKVSVDARFSVSANTVSTDYETRGYYHAKIADLFLMTSTSGVPYTSYTKQDYQRLWERRNDVTEHPDRPWVITEMRNGKMSYTYLANFDWYNYLYDESRPTQDYNVSISGGSKNVTYLVSGRYYGQKGVNRVAPDYFDSYNARAKLSIKLRPWLTLGNNTKFFHSKYTYTGYNDDEKNFRWPTLHALSSFVPVNPDGTAVSHTSLTENDGHYIMDGYNAMLRKGKAGGYNATTEVTTTFDLTANICDGLVFKADFSYKFGYLRNRFRNTQAEYSRYPGVVSVETSKYHTDYFRDVVYEQNNYTANGYFAYDKTWKEAHHFTATAGVNFESRNYKDLTVERNDLLSEDLSDMNLATGDLRTLKGGVSEYALMGAFYRLTYDYKSRYLIEFNGRYDGSSRFLKGHQWGFFPSVSAAYRISEEPFWKPIKNVFNNMKIRLSYGSLGNQQIGYYDYYQSISTEGTMSYSHDGKTLSGHATVGDPVTTGTWETVVSKNLGFDFGFFGDKLTLESDFYIRDTKGILTEGKKLPSIYGANEPQVNANDLRTQGFELLLQWKDSFNLAGHRFDYSVGANLADYTAYYTRCDNPSGLIGEPYVGKRLGEIWGFRVGGLFATDQEAAAYDVDMSAICKNYNNANSLWGAGVRAGDMKYLDISGNDNKITFGKGTLDDPGDREVIGNSQPRYSYGFNLGFNYFGFDFSIFFQGIGHMDWYPGADNQRFWGPYSRPYVSFVPRDFMADVWSETNPDAYFPRPRGYAALNTSNGSLYYTNDRYLQNLAYLRLKNLTFGYTFPEKWMSKAGISKLRLYFSGENIWTWSAVHSKYVDPEQMAANSNKNGDTYPWYKTFSFGLSLEF